MLDDNKMLITNKVGGIESSKPTQKFTMLKSRKLSKTRKLSKSQKLAMS